MPMHKRRSPDAYPMGFHLAMRQAIDHFRTTRDRSTLAIAVEPVWSWEIVREGETPRLRAQMEAKRWLAFRSNLRLTPRHPLYEGERDLAFRASVREVKGGWQLFLTAQLKFGPTLEDALPKELLEKVRNLY